MKYNEAIAAINTERALRLLDIALRINGNYIYFPCVECGKESAIRYYGMKKKCRLLSYLQKRDQYYRPGCKDKEYGVSGR